MRIPYLSAQHTGVRRPLSQEHLLELEGSGIAPQFFENRYFTVTEAEARELGFSEAQAHDGWAVELVSPTGEVSYQLKAKRPRRDKHAKPIKYETRAGHDIVVDVHRHNHRRLAYVDEPIVVTEGMKKADCLASRGYLAVGLSGVWNWGKKRKRGGAKYGRPELLPDWDHIPLEGRIVFLLFDLDYREKQNVALGLLRLAERLTERGAKVYIASLPGPEKGVDDYYVAGGDLAVLLRDARPFQASNLIRYAAKRDRRIWRVVESNLETMRTDDLSTTTHSLLRAHCELALLGGRYDRERDAVEIVIGTRDLRQYAGIGSPNTLTRHNAILGERGYIEVVPGDPAKGKANRYVLKLHVSVPLIERGGEVSTDSIPGTPLCNFVPHLRWPAPSAPEHEPWRESASPNELMKATGKRAEMALDLLLSWGGDGTLRDLACATGAARTNRMRADLADFADAGIVVMDPKGQHHARVRVADDWERRLDERQEQGGELARARRQAVRHRDSREGYRSKTEVDKAPGEGELMGRERVKEILEKQRDEIRVVEAERAAAEQDKAIAFLSDVLGGPHVATRGFIRYGLLLEMWAEDHRGTELSLKRALRSIGLSGRRHDEYPGELFVYPPASPEPERGLEESGPRSLYDAMTI